jgi:hypothetical protein
MRLRQSISHSQWSLIHTHLIYPTHNALVLSAMFRSLRSLITIMSYDHCNFVTGSNEFERSKIRESRNVNISICLFIPGSTSRSLSRRVAHHPECRSRSLVFRALRPVRLVESQRLTLPKTRRPSCSAKRPRCAPWTAARGRRQRRRPVRRLSSFG